MNLESIRRDALARETGLISDDGEVSERGLADLLRLPLSRWGLAPRSAVLRHARLQLEAAGLRDQASSLLPKVLERLVKLRECEDVSIGHERYIAPAPSSWIRTGDGSATLLSVGPVPAGIVERGLGGKGQDIVRRIRLRSDDELAVLRMANVRETTMDEWLKPHGYLLHGIRRAQRLMCSDELSISRFWELVVSATREHGIPLGGDAEVRSVVGKPGDYFGRYDTERCEGRWSEVAPDGVWCAYRRGYGQGHWHPITLEVDGGQRRAMDLHDHDEWRWALLARGRCMGAEERVEQGDHRVQLSFRAPDQLITAMDILGPRRSGWSWEVSCAAPDPWASFT